MRPSVRPNNSAEWSPVLRAADRATGRIFFLPSSSSGADSAIGHTKYVFFANPFAVWAVRYGLAGQCMVLRLSRRDWMGKRR